MRESKCQGEPENLAKCQVEQDLSPWATKLRQYENLDFGVQLGRFILSGMPSVILQFHIPHPIVIPVRSQHTGSSTGLSTGTGIGSGTGCGVPQLLHWVLVQLLPA